MSIRKNKSLVIFKANEVLPVPVEVLKEPKLYAIPYGSLSEQELFSRYFDGYPQIVKREGSKPTYGKVKVEKDVMVPMRDGIKLTVDVYRPGVKGERFPALVAWDMWGKNNQEVVF